MNEIYRIKTSCCLFGEITTDEDKKRVDAYEIIPGTYSLEGSLDEILRKQTRNIISVFARFFSNKNNTSYEDELQTLRNKYNV